MLLYLEKRDFANLEMQNYLGGPDVIKGALI